MGNNMFFTQIEPPKELFNAVLNRIEAEKGKKARINLMFSSIGSAISFAVLFVSFGYLSQSLYQSGFYDFVSLIFSDGSLILDLYQEFGLLILESLPALEIAIVLSALLSFLGLFKNIIKNVNSLSTKVKIA